MPVESKGLYFNNLLSWWSTSTFRPCHKTNFSHVYGAKEVAMPGAWFKSLVLSSCSHLVIDCVVFWGYNIAINQSEHHLPFSFKACPLANYYYNGKFAR